jgi:dynein heavy chain, axonemal
LKSNLRRAFSKFPQDNFERAKSHKEKEYKALLFGLCMFHSIILGRKKFGAQGWSRNYSFNDGDLTICGAVLHNYLEKYEQIPYDDLKYIFGEIMYGGHITDNLDRRTNATYLEKLIKPEILQQMNLTMWHPGFKSPDPMKFDRTKYEGFIETGLPMEVPEMFGLHKNAEIGYLTQTAETLFSMIQQISGGSAGGGEGGGKVVELIHLFLDRTPKPFPSIEMAQKAAEKGRTPYVVVCLQESERMNVLLKEIRNSLNDLDAGLKGTLNMTEAMEKLAGALALNNVPANWFKVAYHSNKSLLLWLDDLNRRVQQFDDWANEFTTPHVVWLSGLFNPMSYLTAIMQVTARKDFLPLDDMCLKTEVMNVFEPEEMPEAAENGAYIYGLSLEGAGWELGRNGE